MADLQLTGDVAIDFSKLNAQLSQVRAATEPTRQSLQQLASATANTAKAQEQAAAATAKTRQEVGRAREAISQMGGATAQAGQALGILRAGLTAVSGGVVGATVAVAAIVVGLGLLAKAAVEASESIARLQASLIPTVRSVEELGTATQFVRRLAEETGQSVEQLGQRYVEASQRARSLGVSQEQLRRNFEETERATARLRDAGIGMTVSQAATELGTSLTKMLAGFDNLLGISRTIAAVFLSIKSVVDTIASWLPAAGTSVEHLNVQVTASAAAIERLRAIQERIRRGEEDSRMPQLIRQLGLQEARANRIEALERQIAEHLRNQTTWRLEITRHQQTQIGLTEQQKTMLDGITADVKRQMDHQVAIGGLLQHQQEVRNQMLQIELQLLRAGVDATVARQQASQFQGQLEITQAAQQFQSIRQSLLSQEQLEMESFNTRLLQLQTFGQARADMATQVNALIEAEHFRHTQALTLIQLQSQQHLLSAQMAAGQAGVQVLQLLGAKSKVAAVAAIAINTALSVVQATQNTAVAATRALAELGPIAGPPAAAAISAWGAAQVALIIAAGALQAGSALSSKGGPSIGGGGGGSGGGAGLPEQQGEMPTRLIIEPVDPAAIFTGSQLNNLIEVINERAANGTIVAANRVI